jgi:aspartyl/glutamyl-tRNA(Asn/Gln) amidotransferase C subunit
MVDAEEVKSVAENARIKVEDEEAENFAEDFEDILEMFETLDEIDTEDIEPAFHPCGNRIQSTGRRERTDTGKGTGLPEHRKRGRRILQRA